MMPSDKIIIQQKNDSNLHFIIKYSNSCFSLSAFWRITVEDSNVSNNQGWIKVKPDHYQHILIGEENKFIFLAGLVKSAVEQHSIMQVLSSWPATVSHSCHNRQPVLCNGSLHSSTYIIRTILYQQHRTKKFLLLTPFLIHFCPCVLTLFIDCLVVWGHLYVWGMPG